MLESRRNDMGSRLKEIQLKRTCARGTLEFWARRRSETELRVFDEAEGRPSSVIR